MPASVVVGVAAIVTSMVLAPVVIDAVDLYYFDMDFENVIFFFVSY